MPGSRTPYGVMPPEAVPLTWVQEAPSASEGIKRGGGERTVSIRGADPVACAPGLLVSEMTRQKA